jgi:Chaperone of endosialidase
MNLRRLSYALTATAALVATAFQPCVAQMAQSLNPQSSAPLAASASTAVPALVPFSGLITEPDGKPISGEAAVTLVVFKDQTGGELLFAETQAVNPDASGHYKVQLGATLANGLPSDLFATGEARWLEVQPAGQPPQPRVLMASVPYALKAADSATLGGLPASAFVLAGSKEAAALAAPAVSLAATVTTTASDVTTTGGISGYLAEFSGASSVVDSPLFVNGADVGIGTATPTATLDVNGTTLLNGAVSIDGASTFVGALTIAPSGTATASTEYSSQLLKLYSSAYNSSSKTVVNPRFEWQAEPKGNNSASPTATLNLLSSTTTSGAAETGFSFNANGTINFAPGQTFPGTGTGSITGVTAGTGLTGGGAAGNVTLSANQSVVAFQTDLTNAENTLNANIAKAQSAAVSTSETFANSTFLPLTGGVVNGPTTFRGPASEQYTNGNYFTVQAPSGTAYAGAFGQNVSLSAGSGSDDPAEYAYGGNGGSVIITSGAGGSAVNGAAGNAGNIVLNLGAAGAGYPAGLSGNVLIVGDDNGVYRNTPHQLQIQGASNSGKQLLIGYLADSGGDAGYGAVQATYTGVQNTPLVLNPNGGGVGIQTTNVTNSLTIGQGQGPAVADGWNTYSSRRFKTDIQTLTGALDKVERMRGVSYTLKATGKREIGVIAEEVGQVVPEAVTYEANGKDARSVDYNRLTALLIEATKEQQTLIQQQQKQIKVQQVQIRAQQTAARLQQAQIARLSVQMRTVQAAVNTSDRASSQVRTVAQLSVTRW